MILYNTKNIAHQKLFEQMYKDYSAELSRYSERLRKEPVTNYVIHDINTNPLLLRYFITNENNNPVGFCLMGFGENTHPGTDWYIAEFYVLPEHRNKGYGKTAIKKFIKDHPGLYCYFVLKENRSAKAFWEKVKAELGCEDVSNSYNAQPYTLEDTDFYAFKHYKQNI